MKNVRVFQYDGHEVVEVPMVEVPMVAAENVQIIDFGGRSSQTEPIDPRARKRLHTRSVKAPPGEGLRSDPSEN